MNPWITHVKNYQQSHGCSYREALKGARPSYKPRKRGGAVRKDTLGTRTYTLAQAEAERQKEISDENKKIKMRKDRAWALAEQEKRKKKDRIAAVWADARRRRARRNEPFLKKAARAFGIF